ncbi:MAG: hypothetical protein Q9227_003444 [Pyrenula ochraceoflavens]
MSQALRPLFVTVTWGAGGSTAAKSLELADICQRQLGLTTCLHLTCTNMNRKLVDEALEEAKVLGVRNILALRGDPPRSKEYHIDEEEDSNGDFTYAVDLVRYIRKLYGDYFCIGVAGYPEGHTDESHPEHQSVERDLDYLVEKTKAGADFIMTQLTYDLQAYTNYENTLRSHSSGALKTIPIVPGMMPIQSYQILKRITKLSHVKIPDAISARIEAVKNDDEAVKKVGVDILSEMVEDMKSLPSPSATPRGFHFFTLNLEKSISFILERCKLIPPSTESPSPVPSDVDSDVVVDVNISTDNAIPNGTGHPVRRRSHRRSSALNSQPHNRLIVDQDLSSIHPVSRSSSSNATTQLHEAPAVGSGLPAAQANRSNTLLISEGLGSLGREATWDDFPNGRWGPSSSPAFGEIDGYGPSLHVTGTQARQLWGSPKTHKDITDIFTRHVNGTLSCVPWSDENDMSSTQGGALRAETLTIRTELLNLIQNRGLWTLASQPAVNGKKSDDPVFGWGPPGEGFVFQKAFVEFFVSSKTWREQLRPKLIKYGEEDLSWFATNRDKEYESSATVSGPNSRRPSATLGWPSPKNSNMSNAVTWGVFRGKEIVTPTIIEEESFRAWSNEAYEIWGEWRKVFPRGSQEEKFLEEMEKDLVLVNVVGQRFAGKDGGRLWEILGGA